MGLITSLQTAPTHYVPIKITLSIPAMIWLDENIAGTWILAGYVGDGADEMSVWAFADPRDAFAFKLQFG
ncbi:hypothetical protein SB2_06660 [Methylobacterium radiotolerans]|nr:hypothetical protein SB3_08700 [Methylobacterium radiotolerans]KTS49236.1 hypothetical protein SB2_06660 [Methylobacterium radiotolerans]